MKPIAAGRASEIFDLGDGRVLRRFRAPGDPAREALVMEHARANGFPVPHVHEIRDDALVLDLVEGPTMLRAMRRRPWILRSQALELARLHDQLHEIAAPAGLPASGPGDRLLHLDLHPDNVILSPTGPCVIDWTNARSGDPALDVALTWVIGATSGGAGARPFTRSFLSHFERSGIAAALPDAGALRLADPNVTDRERRAVRRLIERHG